MEIEIENIKNTFAIEKGYKSWGNMFYLLVNARHYNKINHYHQEVMKILYTTLKSNTV